MPEPPEMVRLDQAILYILKGTIPLDHRHEQMLETAQTLPYYPGNEEPTKEVKDFLKAKRRLVYAIMDGRVPIFGVPAEPIPNGFRYPHESIYNGHNPELLPDPVPIDPNLVHYRKLDVRDGCLGLPRGGGFYDIVAPWDAVKRTFGDLYATVEAQIPGTNKGGRPKEYDDVRFFILLAHEMNINGRPDTQAELIRRMHGLYLIIDGDDAPSPEWIGRLVRKFEKLAECYDEARRHRDGAEDKPISRSSSDAVDRSLSGSQEPRVH